MKYEDVNDDMERERGIAAADMTPVMLVLSIAQKYQDEMERQCTALKLGAGARRVMYHLSLEEGVTQLSLVRATGLKAPTISLILQKMERDGLVNRRTDDLDMRMTRVTLTERGREINHILEKTENHMTEVMNRYITDEESEFVRKLLLKMHENLENEQKENPQKQT